MNRSFYMYMFSFLSICLRTSAMYEELDNLDFSQMLQNLQKPSISGEAQNANTTLHQFHRSKSVHLKNRASIDMRRLNERSRSVKADNRTQNFESPQSMQSLENQQNQSPLCAEKLHVSKAILNTSFRSNISPNQAHSLQASGDVLSGDALKNDALKKIQEQAINLRIEEQTSPCENEDAKKNTLQLNSANLQIKNGVYYYSSTNSDRSSEVKSEKQARIEMQAKKIAEILEWQRKNKRASSEPSPVIKSTALDMLDSSAASVSSASSRPKIPHLPLAKVIPGWHPATPSEKLITFSDRKKMVECELMERTIERQLESQFNAEKESSQKELLKISEEKQTKEEARPITLTAEVLEQHVQKERNSLEPSNESSIERRFYKSFSKVRADQVLNWQEDLPSQVKDKIFMSLEFIRKKHADFEDASLKSHTKDADELGQSINKIAMQNVAKLRKQKEMVNDENGVILRTFSMLNLLEYFHLYLEVKKDEQLISLQKKVRELVAAMYLYSEYHNCDLLLNTEHKDKVSILQACVKSVIKRAQLTAEQIENFESELVKVKSILGTAKNRFYPKTHHVEICANAIGEYRELLQQINCCSSKDLFDVFYHEFKNLEKNNQLEKYFIHACELSDAFLEADGGESVQACSGKMEVSDSVDSRQNALTACKTLKDLKNIAAKLITELKDYVSHTSIVVENFNLNFVDLSANNDSSNAKLFVVLKELESRVKTLNSLQSQAQEKLNQLFVLVKDQKLLNHNIRISAMFQKHLLDNAILAMGERALFENVKFENALQVQLQNLSKLFVVVANEIKKNLIETVQ